MARAVRIQYPDGYYHVMNRGNRGEAIFITDSDRAVFWMDSQIAVKPTLLSSSAKLKSLSHG